MNYKTYGKGYGGCRDVPLDDLSNNSCVPCEADVDYIARSCQEFTKKGIKYKGPWVLAYYCGAAASPIGRSKERALRWLLISLLLPWGGLKDQLLTSLTKYFGMNKNSLKQVAAQYWTDAVYQAVLQWIEQARQTYGLSSTKNEGLPLTEDFNVDSLEKTTPYMLRNDGAMLGCGDIHPYIKMYYDEDLTTNMDALLNHPEFIEWFYKNTLLEETRQLIGEFLYALDQTNLIASLKIEKGDWPERKIETIFRELNNATNEEFCRARTSNFKYKYGGDNGAIYFRISSKGFNWFDLIWMAVNQYKDQIKTVTIMKDFAVSGERFAYIKDGKNVFNRMPIEEFLTLGGNPVVETLKEDIEKHDELNPVLFEDGKLKEDVKQALHRIATEFCDGLHENGIKYKLDDIVLTGSNASYNYNKNSDIDLHLRFDTSIYDDEEKQTMAAMIYDYAKKAFNTKYTIKIQDIPVEIYAETNY